MSDWNGSAWTDGGQPQHRTRSADRVATLVMLIGVVAMAVPILGASAATRHASGAGCEVNPSSADVGEVYVVRAWGLPTGIAINLWRTEDGVTTGSPLGSTTDGTFALNEVSKHPGVTTWAFSGPTRKNTTMYASCAVSAY
jgi:hypothetical protein